MHLPYNWQVTDMPDKNLLCKIIRILPVMQKSHAGAKNQGLVTFHQHPVHIPVAFKYLPYYFTIGHYSVK